MASSGSAAVACVDGHRRCTRCFPGPAPSRQAPHPSYPASFIEERRPIENNALLLFYERREGPEAVAAPAPAAASVPGGTPEKDAAAAFAAASAVSVSPLASAVPDAALAVPALVPALGAAAGETDAAAVAGVPTSLLVAATERKVMEMAEYVAKQAWRFDEELFSACVEFCALRRCERPPRATPRRARRRPSPACL